MPALLYEGRVEHGSHVPRAARFAVATIFFVNGAGIANWVVRIPAVRDGLHLTTGTLGVALLGMSVGALLAMPFVGWLVARFGSRPLTFASALAFLAALPLPALAPSLPLLAAGLVVLGASSAALGVSMNAHAVLVERRYDHPIMSSFHALFSLGGMAGSASGGALAALGLRPLPHLMLMAAVLAALSLVALARLLPREADALGQHGPAFARPSRTLLALGAMAFCVLLGEGAMADWTAVYLRDVLGTGPGLAAAGYGAFSLAMASGRLAGDALGRRLG
ncbi:MAG TPA: MFS transporter, partial [Longimicrobium sp.]|nr:MFS transporter [Longimicrobium sp.]